MSYRLIKFTDGTKARLTTEQIYLYRRIWKVKRYNIEDRRELKSARILESKGIIREDPKFNGWMFNPVKEETIAEG